MSATDSRQCPECGTDIPAGFPEGLCPPCMMQGAVNLGPMPDPASGSPLSPGAASRQAALEIDVLQPWFPELEIVRLLGQGGMGAVYLARQPKLDRLVALKVLLCPEEWHENFALRFEQEARDIATRYTDAVAA